MLCLRRKFALSLPLLVLATGLGACSSEVPPPVFVPDASLAIDVPGQDVQGAVDRGPAADDQPATDTVAVTDNGASEDRGAAIDSGTPGTDATVNTDSGTPGQDATVNTDSGTPGQDATVNTDSGTPGPDAMVFPGDNGIHGPIDAMVFPGDNGIHGTDAMVFPGDNGIHGPIDVITTDNGIHGPIDVITTDNGIHGPIDVITTDNGIHGGDVINTDNGIGTTDASGEIDASSVSHSIGGIVSDEGAGVSGATVVVVDRAGATVVTGADGRFAFPLPTGSTHLFRMTRSGARTLQEMVLVPFMAVTNLRFNLLANEDIAEVFTTVSLTESATQGIIMLRFSVDGTHPGGYGATLNVTGGVRVVAAESGTVRRDTTVPNEDTLFIMNVPTGPVTVTAVPPAGRSCTPAFGTAATRVDARIITNVNFNCR